MKIDLEIAEIIEVKVGNHHLEIDIFLVHRGRKIISMLKVATLTSIISVLLDTLYLVSYLFTYHNMKLFLHML